MENHRWHQQPLRSEQEREKTTSRHLHQDDQMLELYCMAFYVAVVNMVQQTITNSLGARTKMENLNNEIEVKTKNQMGIM